MMDDINGSMGHVNGTSSPSLPLLGTIGFMDGKLFTTALIGVFVGFVLVYVLDFFYKAQSNRSICARMRHQGKPMPPWNAFLGHLLAAMRATQDLPPHAAGPYVIHRLSKQYGTSGAYYLDTWPISAPLLVVTDANMANQVTNHPKTGAEKPRTLVDWFMPITGGANLFTQNGPEWKMDHEMVIPAFSNRNLDAALQSTVPQLLILRDKLRANAKASKLFELEPLTLAMMNNVIGKFLFDTDLDAQSRLHPLSERMLRQLAMVFSNHNPNAMIVSRLNPFFALKKRNNSRALNKLILEQVTKRVGVYKAAKARGGDTGEEFKCLLDVVLEEYFSQPGHDVSRSIDARFLQRLCCQMRVLFFGGYDSTSATMVACCYKIWQNPDVLQKLRAEHDQVFGANADAAPDQMADNPAILNALPYTNAVIKETMRLFPPANGIREGCPDLVLRAEDGTEYPTDGCAVQINHISIHHDAKYWPRPTEFLPERWLVEPGHELYPPKGAWRTFELGVRNCPGQSKVVRDVKAFLVIVARELDFEERYAEIDGDETRDVAWVFGEKAYLTEAGAAHLRDRYPCRVSLSGYVAGN